MANHTKPSTAPTLRLAGTLLAVLLLAWFFAQTEIQIEGPAGWGKNLPTWRVENHWLLDLFWGGRAMTGYHAWVFPFIALFFHFPVCFVPRWTARHEARVLACIIWFWIAEDFLWFMLNPAFGWAKFAPQFATWHKHWWGHAPIEYWIFAIVSVVLLAYSDPRRTPVLSAGQGVRPAGE